jgi:serine/threonine protein kinase
VSPQRWSRVRELFDSAVDRLPSEVEDYLRSACGGDEELLGEVRRMLEQHRAAGFLDAPPVRPPLAFQPGDVAAGRYRILRKLGHGGMGQVYEAEDTELRERVALKTLLPDVAADSGMIARFKREIQLARKIGHPHVCRVFDLARHPADGSSPNAALFLTMEFLEGETLAEYLNRESRIAPAEAMPLLAQMADALDAAHRTGIIHRDFKPANVMLVPGERGAVVTDFGLARTVEVSGDTTATATGQLVGTIDYMAPELFTGAPATPAADVYALGLVAYRMVTGKLPFESESPLAGVVRRAGQAPPPARTLVPDLPPTWDRGLAIALDPDPVRRFGTCGEFVGALRGGAASVTVKLPVMTRGRWAMAVAAAVLLIAGMVGWRSWKAMRNRPSPEVIAYYRRGVDDIQAGAPFAAAKALDEAVKLAPGFSLAHARLAEAWAARSQPERAGEEMLRARRQDLSSLSQLDRAQIEAIDLKITRDFAAAAAKYESMRHLSGANDGEISVDLGRAYEQASIFDKALENFRRAAEGPTHSPAAWLRSAVLYDRAGKFSDSDHAFAEAERLYQLTSNLEGLAEIALQRGIAAIRRRHGDEGVAYLRKTIEIAHMAGDVYKEIDAKLQLSTNASNSSEPALAERYARESLDAAQAGRIEDETIRAHIALGQAHAMNRNFSGAEKDYQAALASAERDRAYLYAARSHLMLASLYDQTTRPEDAAREAQQALSYYQPNHFVQESLNALVLMGRSQRSSGDYPSALKAFQSLVSAAESSHDRQLLAQAYEGVGTVLVAQEQFPQALEYFQKDLDAGPQPRIAATAQVWRGYVLALLGRDQEAVATWHAADSEAEKLPSLKLYLELRRAALALSWGRYPEARKLTQEILAGPIQRDAIATATALELRGLAAIGLGKKAEGRNDCEQALSGVAAARNAAATLQAQMALLQARIETADAAGAVAIFHQIEPTLSTYPESHWRAMALMVRGDSQRVPAAADALAALQRQWGNEVCNTYLHRPDIQKLSRPLLQFISAKSH